MSHLNLHLDGIECRLGVFRHLLKPTTIAQSLL
jgi:hypothetical protein